MYIMNTHMCVSVNQSIVGLDNAYIFVQENKFEDII